jgi:DNA replication and repair protein RecF
LKFDGVPQREHFSRGQTKAVALVCVLALTKWLKDNLGEYPLLCLDDLESELDATHTALIIEWLSEKSIQSWLTKTCIPELSRQTGDIRMFHVKRSGCVRPDES